MAVETDGCPSVEGYSAERGEISVRPAMWLDLGRLPTDCFVAAAIRGQSEIFHSDAADLHLRVQVFTAHQYQPENPE